MFISFPFGKLVCFPAFSIHQDPSQQEAEQRSCSCIAVVVPSYLRWALGIARVVREKVDIST